MLSTRNRLCISFAWGFYPVSLLQILLGKISSTKLKEIHLFRDWHFKDNFDFHFPAIKITELRTTAVYVKLIIFLERINRRWKLCMDSSKVQSLN